MDNKKVTPMELNDDALDTVNGGINLAYTPYNPTPANGPVTAECAKCHREFAMTNVVYVSSLVNGKYYCDDCRKKKSI